MKPISTPSTVVIVAGETSGDQHGARLVNALQARTDRLHFHGVGGPALQRAGVHILVDAATLSVVGVTEVAAKLPAILKGLKTVKRSMRKLKPDLLILIDFQPGSHGQKTGNPGPILYQSSDLGLAARAGEADCQAG
jgi:lipid-A-disaccharide synthase